MMDAIKQLMNHIEVEEVRAGQPLRFSEACTTNDRIWQGDLALTITDGSIPDTHVKADKPTVQLVKGNTIGARHCLDSLEGVDMYVPTEWTEESLVGPILVMNKERSVVHPIHGDVTVPAGFSVSCTYQREYDEEQKRERRARD